MNFKWLILLASLVIVLSAASASVKMDVYPTDGIDSGEDFLVFGYIGYDKEISSNDLELRIYDDNGELYKKVEPYFEDNDHNGFDTSGFFYRKISLGETGDYEIKLRVEDHTEDSEMITVKDIDEKDVKITDFDYSISGGNIKFTAEIKNQDSEDHQVTVYFKGKSNWNSPAHMTLDVDAHDAERVSKTYSLSTFGSDDFIVVAYAETDSDGLVRYSEPEYVIVDTGNFDDYDYNYDDYNYNYDYHDYGYYYNAPAGNLDITAIELGDSAFYPGDVVDGFVTIQNHGSSESQYRFEYIVNNQVFKKGDVGYAEGYYSANEPISIEIPDADTVKITAKVYGNGLLDTMERTFMVSHKLKYFSPYLSDNMKTVTAGENVTIKLLIKNRGNENDSYRLDLEGWDKYTMQNEVSIAAAKEKEVNVTFEVPADAYVKTYPIIIDICNTQDVCRTKNFELKVSKEEVLQSSLIWNDSQTAQYFEENETLVYKFTVKNTEIIHKDYTVNVEAGDAKVKVSDDIFTLAPNESTEVRVDITPADNENATATIALNAEGEQIFSKEVKMTYTEDKEKALGLTGFAFFDVGEAYTPGLYMLALIGVASLAFVGYRFVQQGLYEQKARAYERMRTQVETPRVPVQPTFKHYAPQFVSRPVQLAPRQPEEYSPDSFMRQM